MKPDLHDLFISLLPLHEFRIEQEIKKMSHDQTNELFDYSQIRLSTMKKSDRDIKIRFKDQPAALSFLDASEDIANTEKLLHVLLKFIQQTHSSSEPEMRCIALVYREQNLLIDGVNSEAIAKAHGYTSRSSGRKLKDLYNQLIDTVAYEDALKRYSLIDRKKVKIL